MPLSRYNFQVTQRPRSGNEQPALYIFSSEEGYGGLLALGAVATLAIAALALSSSSSTSPATRPFVEPHNDTHPFVEPHYEFPSEKPQEKWTVIALFKDMSHQDVLHHMAELNSKPGSDLTPHLEGTSTSHSFKGSLLQRELERSAINMHILFGVCSSPLRTIFMVCLSKNEHPRQSDPDILYITENIQNACNDTFQIHIPPALEYHRTSSKPPEISNSLGIQVLHHPPHYSTIPLSKAPLVDVIFVHSLGGSSIGTWTHTETGGFWPNWLSNVESLENVRVASYGYDTNYFVRQGTALGIHDFADDLLESLKKHYNTFSNTPTIFVAHSLGGLVVKKAIMIAYEQGLVEVMQNVAGIVFLGTPHDAALKAEMLDRVLKVTIGERDYINELTLEIPIISEINAGFAHRVKSLKMMCYYETHPCGPFGIIVPESSATLIPDGRARRSALYRNHVEISKFPSESDSDYKRVAETIAMMSHQVVHEIAWTS